VGQALGLRGAPGPALHPENVEIFAHEGERPERPPQAGGLPHSTTRPDI